jgi:WD40 repeat protein
VGPAADGLNNSIYIFERASGRIVGRIDGLPNVIFHLAFSRDGRHLVACLGGPNGIRVYETEGFGEIAADRSYSDHSYWAAFDRNGRLVTSSWDGQIRLYDPSFRLIDSKAPGGAQPFGVAFSPDGAQVAVGYEDSTRVDLLDGRTLEPLFEVDTTGITSGNRSTVAWSTDGRYLYAGGSGGLAHGERLRRWADGGRSAYEDIAPSQNTIMDLRPLADGRLAFGAFDPSLGVLGSDGQILWRQDPATADLRDQERRFAVSGDGAPIVFGFEQFGNSPAAFDLAARRLTLDPEPDSALATARIEAPGLEIVGWKNEHTPTLNGARLPLDQYETSRSLAITPDGARFLLGGDWSLRLFGRNGKQVWEKPVPGAAWAVNITGDGRLAVVAFADGTIRWFRLEKGEELLAFFPHADRERWVVWTPQGYYMASPGGEELIGWHVNRDLDTPEFYTAGRFRDRFHRPDVIALVLDEQDVQKALARANAEAGVAAVTPSPEEVKEQLVATLPPVIQILEPASGTRIDKDPVSIKYRVWTLGGESVPTVRVMVNGALAMSVSEPEPAVPPEGREGAIDVRVIPRARDGKAIIRLIAEGAHGESDPAAIGLHVSVAAPKILQPKAKLLVLAVGVSQYKQHPPRDLRYAAKDAEDIVRMLQSQRGGLYEEVLHQLLPDEHAGATEIVQGFRWLREQARPGDVVMVFFSGHGVVESDVYHFLPHDVVVTTADDLSLTAINQDRLMRSLTALYKKEVKVLAFLDTCHSGAFGDDTRSLPPDIDRMAAALASQGTGAIVFTAGTGREVAKEHPDWENGALTEALLEALRGEAGRPYLRVSDLQRYLTERVTKLTDGAQNPRIEVPFKELFDLPIAVIH